MANGLVAYEPESPTTPFAVPTPESGTSRTGGNTATGTETRSAAGRGGGSAASQDPSSTSFVVGNGAGSSDTPTGGKHRRVVHNPDHD